MFDTIVVAVDGSDHANHAIVTACDIAQKYNSDIHLVHSPELETVAYALGYSAVEVQPTAEKITEAGNRIMQLATEQSKQHNCTPVEGVIANGDPAEVVLEHAKKCNASLIVAGRRGLGSLAGVFVGSVSQKISQKASCAFLTIK